MDADVEELYSNINKLLEDISKFLNDKDVLTTLSPQARKQADELLNRSKKQLKEIAQVTENGAYVDMERRQEDEDDENEIYSEPSAPVTTPVITSSIITTKSKTDVEDKPAKNLSKSIKNGMLSWKCRVFFNFTKLRKVYAGIDNQNLLIYSSENDLKPIHSFDLKSHIAKEANAKNKNEFEIISASEDKKDYFLALTRKDMLQWVSRINDCRNNLNFNHSEEDNEDDDVIYDTVLNPNQVKNSKNLETSTKTEQIITDTINSQPPDLPARRIITIPLPPIPKREQNKSNDDPIEAVEAKPKVLLSLAKTMLPTESFESRKSFSSDEDDDKIYGHVLPTTPQAKNIVKPPIAAKPKPNVQNSEKLLKRQVSIKSVESNSSFSNDDEDDDIAYGTVVISK